MAKGGWVNITANRFRGGLYVGVTANMLRRVHQHREGSGAIHVVDFAKQRLVCAERRNEIAHAIARERLVKKWRREWTFVLIAAAHPDWDDL